MIVIPATTLILPSRIFKQRLSSAHIEALDLCYGNGFEQILDQTSRAYFPDNDELKGWGDVNKQHIAEIRQHRRISITTEALEDASIFIDEIYNQHPDDRVISQIELVTKKYIESGWLCTALDMLQEHVNSVFMEYVGHDNFYISDVGDDFVHNWSGAYQEYVIKPL